MLITIRTRGPPMPLRAPSAAEVGLLGERPVARVRPPRPHLTSSVERPFAHQRAVRPEELPRAVHLAVEVRPPEPHVPVRVVVDGRGRLFGLVHWSSVMLRQIVGNRRRKASSAGPRT